MSWILNDKPISVTVNVEDNDNSKEYNFDHVSINCKYFFSGQPYVSIFLEYFLVMINVVNFMVRNVRLQTSNLNRMQNYLFLKDMRKHSKVGKKSFTNVFKRAFLL